jgi:hypothetical protein
MTTAAIKKRSERAKQKAERDLEAMGYDVVQSDNRRVCLIGFRRQEVRLVKICLDRITSNDTAVVRSISAPENCSREIWLRKERSCEFEVHKL